MFPFESQSRLNQRFVVCKYSFYIWQLTEKKLNDVGETKQRHNLCYYAVIISAVHSVCCSWPNLAFWSAWGGWRTKHQTLHISPLVQLRGQCLGAMCWISPCYFGLCRHTGCGPLPNSQCASLSLFLCLKGTAPCSSSSCRAQTVSHCAQQSTPRPLSLVTRRSQRKTYVHVVCVRVCLFH